MARESVFEWHAKEYAAESKNAEWYWALGVISIALFVACVIFNNILLGLVVLAGAASVSIQAVRKPRMHRFSIDEHGVTIDNRMYPFSGMLHFSVFEYIDETLPPALSLKTRNLMFPHLVIPIVGYDPVDVYHFVAAHVEEGKHHESAIDHVIEMIKL